MILSEKSSKTYFYKISYRDDANFYNMHYWLEKNCKGKFYTSPAWAGKFIQFENVRDAALFSLTWA